MYIILRQSEWFDCDDSTPETLVAPTGFTKLSDAVEHIENELVPEDKTNMNEFEDEELLHEVLVYGDRLNPLSYEVHLVTKFVDDKSLLREIFYSIQEIQVR